MNILIADTETTGVDPSKDTVIEVAVCLFSCTHGAPIATFATLIESTSNAAEHINKIPPALLGDAMEAQAAWARVEELAHAAECFVAHNAPFDRRFTPLTIAEMVPWVCSQRDIEWPEGGADQKLITVAVAHGVPIIGAHRALTDVDILVRVFQRLHERKIDVAELLREAMRPRPLLQALVSFDDKDLAKKAGFEWNPAPKKMWTKKMSLEAAARLPFKTKVLKEA
jgi:DNA polymerase-3 subunit epsilon